MVQHVLRFALLGVAGDLLSLDCEVTNSRDFDVGDRCAKRDADHPAGRTIHATSATQLKSNDIVCPLANNSEITKMNTLISRYLDHAVLKPEMTAEEAHDAIALGIAYRVRTVCVRPCDISMAVNLCKGSETDVCCVLAFRTLKWKSILLTAALNR